MIVVVPLNGEVDRELAKRIANWLHGYQKTDAWGRKYAEFYVWGDHTRVEQ